jgi:hypothetical protein
VVDLPISQLLRAQQNLVGSSTNNTLVRRGAHGGDTFLELAAQCLGPNKSVFIASPTGTVWKASLMQILRGGLPHGIPEIRLQEFLNEKQAEESGCEVVIEELPGLRPLPAPEYVSTDSRKRIFEVSDECDESGMDLCADL